MITVPNKILMDLTRLYDYIDYYMDKIDTNHHLWIVSDPVSGSFSEQHMAVVYPIFHPDWEVQYSLNLSKSSYYNPYLADPLCTFSDH